MNEVVNYTRLVAEYSDLLTEEIGKKIAEMKVRLKK